MEHASASTPLLADSETNSSGQLKQAYSDCRLHDKCFLSDGAAKSSESYKKVQRKLVTACILCFVFMAVEVVGGYIAKSVAIMSDAAHMLSDVSAFLVSIFATWAATQSSSWHYSFGYHRAEILGALISVLTIWAVTGALVFEAVQRVINPVKVDGKLMFIIACAGVVFNILIGLTLGVHAHLGHSHAHDDDHGHDHGHAHHHDHDHEHQHDHHDAHAGSKHKHDHSSCKSGKADHEFNHHKHDSDCNGASCNGHGPDHSHHSSGDSSHSRDSEHDHAHDHDHDHGHESEHAQQDTTSGHASPAATAFAHSSVVIDVPADGSASDSHKQPRGGHCTIKKAGSREIEIQYELPVSALPAAKAPGHTHAHDHDHGGHNHGCHSHGSINLRSAVLHVIGDLLQSIGVAIAGGLIWLNQDDPRWHLADPICTFVFSIVVLLTTKSVLKDIINVLMERTPRHINIPAMSQVMSSMDGIIDVHDLHIWNISTSTKPVLTAHVHIGPDADPTAILQQLEQYVRRLGIDHSTIQICNAQRSLSTSLSDA